MSLKGINIVHRAIEMVNKNKADEDKISTDSDTNLMGDASTLDSLTIVNLFVAIEQVIEDETGEVVIVVDQDAIGTDEHPFRTVATLAEHLDKRLS